MTAVPDHRAASNERRIGWIGAGRMGAALATRLLRSGYRVAVYNRTRAKAEPLARHGAVIVDGLADLAGYDVVFSAVAGSADFAAITTGPGGLLSGGDPPAILVDCSTVSVEASAAVREAAANAGMALLAAPVSGNPRVVAAGRAGVVASGPAEAYQSVAPLLAALGTPTYVGEGEAARLVKVCHNVFLAAVIQSLAEVTVLAEKGGVSRADFLGFINSSVLGSAFTRYKTPALVHLDFTPTFPLPMLRKDLDLGLAEASRLAVPMPLAALTRQFVQSAIGSGRAGEDFAALLMEVARSAGIHLTPDPTPINDGLT